MGSLDGRRIVVTGGANGIGAATVRAYSAEGARVVSLDLEAEAGDAVARDAPEPGSVRFARCDLTDRRQVDEVVDAAVAELGGLDVLAHIAGAEAGAPAEEIDDDGWHRMLAVNATSTLYTNQAAFRAMREGGGSIVNFGSAAGVKGQPGSAHYAASKGAVLAWTRTAAMEWGRYGITVNAVAPAIWTRMYEGYRSRLGPDELAEHDAYMASQIPIGGRLGDPERDLAPVMVFLAGPGARFITGQTIPVDGGVLMMS